MVKNISWNVIKSFWAYNGKKLKWVDSFTGLSVIKSKIFGWPKAGVEGGAK